MANLLGPAFHVGQTHAHQPSHEPLLKCSFRVKIAVPMPSNRIYSLGFALASPYNPMASKLSVRGRFKSTSCINGLILLTLLNILQLLLYIGLLALIGQGFLYLISGQGRDSNMFYQLFQILNKPWVWLARRISPSKVADHQVPFVAFFAMGVTYLAVTLAKIEHCVDVAMQGCR